jgi:hypothetical protein
LSGERASPICLIGQGVREKPLSTEARSADLKSAYRATSLAPSLWNTCQNCVIRSWPRLEPPPGWQAERLSRLQAGAPAAAIIPNLKTDHSTLELGAPFLPIGKRPRACWRYGADDIRFGVKGYGRDGPQKRNSANQPPRANGPRHETKAKSWG